MWKLTCLLTAAFSAAFVAGSQGRFVYSPFETAIPFGTAIKMTPDPSSIWSWHHDVTGFGNQSIPVLVDIDANGQMDTADPWRRVLVTDLQAASPQSPLVRIALRDDSGDLWDLTQVPASSANASVTNQAFHLVTPLALTPGSNLFVDIQPPSTGGYNVRIHLIGRVVNL